MSVHRDGIRGRRGPLIFDPQTQGKETEVLGRRTLELHAADVECAGLSAPEVHHPSGHQGAECARNEAAADQGMGKSYLEIADLGVSKI